MSGRDVTPEFIDAINEGVIRPRFFVELETRIETLRLWSGTGDRIWDSKTWTGVGDFGAISAIGETTSLRAMGITLTLSGVPSHMVQYCIEDARPFKPCKVWVAWMDEDDEIVEDPYQCFGGRTSRAQIKEGSTTSTISVNVEGRLIDLQRSRERRYTDQDQQEQFPGDRGFEFVNELQNAQIPWGQPTGRQIPRGSPAPQPTRDDE
jgi:hypothetical protein